MARKHLPHFNPKTFLSKIGSGKSLLKTSKPQLIFSQGDTADAVLSIKAGQVKLTVLSEQGKEAVVRVLELGSFFGEACLAGSWSARRPPPYWSESTIVRIDKAIMLRVLMSTSCSLLPTASIPPFESCLHCRM